ncbi:hypothetical protein HNR23_003872 [Nocardiopsis mwathae]|uniref:Uncharacterized protein n=1 Tax=Nocardiopsis mwathae TaxID=1472723 RepID=A0A7W9YKP9_9ACTN|nr:hypothetical protein [Nocardiopsis mwathae]MBB6173812.1 hypothetical protein [Nocardiopsis mwathae]
MRTPQQQRPAPPTARPTRSRRYRPYASAPPPATKPDRSRLPGPGRHARQPVPSHPALQAWSRRPENHRAYTAYKHRTLNETAGQTRSLFTICEQLPYSCAIIGAMLLTHLLGLLGW